MDLVLEKEEDTSAPLVKDLMGSKEGKKRRKQKEDTGKKEIDDCMRHFLL